MADTPEITDCEAGADLAPWDRYRSDLAIRVRGILTEPLCPCAEVYFELPERAGIGTIAVCHAGTIEGAVKGALARAVRVLRGDAEPDGPFGWPEDHIKWERPEHQPTPEPVQPELVAVHVCCSCGGVASVFNVDDFKNYCEDCFDRLGQEENCDD